jgi:FkbM family methyltransferase
MFTKNFVVNQKTIVVNIRDEADESVSAEIFKLREYKMAEATISTTTLPILDVGAHAGFFSLYARALNSSVSIIALEPEPHNLQVLAENLKNNKASNITVVKGALAKAKGERELMRSRDSHNHKLKTSDAEKGSIIVQAYSLKDLSSKYFPQGIGLIKMDIEGGEYEVFSSLDDQDFADIKAVVMEYHDLPKHKHQEIEQTLREHGFGVQIFPSKFDKTMGFLWAVNKRNQ